MVTAAEMRKIASTKLELQAVNRARELDEKRTADEVRTVQLREKMLDLFSESWLPVITRQAEMGHVSAVLYLGTDTEDTPQIVRFATAHLAELGYTVRVEHRKDRPADDAPLYDVTDLHVSW